MSNFEETRRALGLSGSRGKDKTMSVTLKFLAKTELEILAVGFPEFFGMPESNRAFENMENGEIIVSVTYEGYPNDEAGQQDPTPEETEEWSGDYDYSEEPLESHWNFEQIRKTYGGVLDEEGKVSFPEKLPKDVSSRNGLGGRARRKGEKNPLFGHETFPLLNGSVTRTFSTRTLPRNLLLRGGTIVDSIPDAPDDINALDIGNRNWLVMPPKFQPKGDVWVVTEEYRLSPPGGWPEEVHELVTR